MNADILVNNALQEARKGQKGTARHILIQALKLDPHNARAWFLLSFLVQEEQHIIYCLSQVLKLQPRNKAANEKLRSIQQSHSTPPAQPLSKSKTPKSTAAWPWLFTILFFTLVVFIGAAFLWRAAPLLETFLSPAIESQPAPIHIVAAGFAVDTPQPSSTNIQPLPATNTLMPSSTPTLTSTITPSITPSPTASVTSTETPTQMPTSTLSVMLIPPKQAHITNITGVTQRMPLSCEASSASDWAAFFGKYIDEYEFQSRLPVSDNPDKGFVGNVMGTWGQIPPAPYGVHADPVADLLVEYGLNAEAVHNFTLHSLKQEIAAGRPVIVWITGIVEPGSGIDYVDSEGTRTIVAPYEHTVIVTGYTDTSITILDGSNKYQRSLTVFLQSWQTLGFQAIIMKS